METKPSLQRTGDVLDLHTGHWANTIVCRPLSVQWPFGVRIAFSQALDPSGVHFDAPLYTTL